MALVGPGCAPQFRNSPSSAAVSRVSQYPERGYCQIGFKTIPSRRSSARGADVRRFLTSFTNLASTGEMRRILLSTVKILISAALLYFSLRKINLADLASRLNVSSLGWIGLAIAVTFLQIF